MKTNAILKDGWFIMRRFSVSWVGILAMVVLLLVAMSSFMLARATLVALLGILGAFAAYRLHFGDRRVNPYLRLRRKWKLPRMSSVFVIAGMALTLATALFFEGVFMSDAAVKMSALHFAFANGFFFFGMVYGMSGWLSVTDAREKIRRASFDDKQRWREEIGRMNPNPSDLRRLMNTVRRLSVLPATQYFSARTESD